MAGALPIFNRINFRRGCFMKKSFQRVIATLNLFQGKQSLTIFLLAAFFALSGCDDSSSASSNGPDENAAVESSSSVRDADPADESSSSVDKKSSGNETKEKDKSSSSSVVSSSSKKVVSSSSDKETSSSSVKANSLESSSSSKKNESGSSSSVKQSSSSVKSSSSKTQNPWGTDSEWQPFNLASFEYGIYTDTREPENIREYHYLTIYSKEHSDSLTVFAENLNIGKMVDGSENQSDNSEIERYCYDNDTLICHYYGGLYQWAEMMGFNDSCNTKSCAHLIKENHQGICPKEWRLMTYDDLEFIKKSEYVIHNSRDDLRTSFGFNGYNTTGFSLVQTGMRLDPIGGGGFQSFSSSAYWFYPEEKIVDGYHVGKDGVVNNSSLTSNVSLKTNGLSVRCVKIQ